MALIKNQVHPPLPKKKRVDKLGNDRKRMFFKQGNSSMLLCKGLTEVGCEVFRNSILQSAKKLGTAIEGNFIIVP